MKTLKKHFAMIASISLLLLAGCSDGSSPAGSGSGEGKGSSGNTVTDIKQSNQVLSFAKLTDAKALAGVSSESGATANIAARAATGEDSAIVKILEDGSISSLLSFPSQVTPPQVSDMIKSETPNGTFLYIIFDSSKTRYNYKTSDGTQLKGYIGQILCVHEDGTFHDILGTEGDITPVRLYSKIHNSLQFDGTGNMYYMTYNDSSSGSVLYRYSPFTGAKTALTAAISGVSVNTFQISKDGKWVFTCGNSGNNNFLRATPISDTENPQNILYGNDKYYENWVYDDTTDSVYVASGSNLYKYTKDATTGTFSTDSYETLVGSSDSAQENQDKMNEFWEKSNNFSNAVYNNLFNSHSESTYTADWKGFLSYWHPYDGTKNIVILNDDDSLNAENLLTGLLIRSWDSFSEDKRYSEWVTDSEGYGHRNALYLTSDDVDLRFDLFADIEGFEALAEATAGKKNAEALAALDTKENRGLLYKLLYQYDSQSRYVYDSTWECYAYNFFADVLYVKDTDTLLVDSEDSPFAKSTVKTTAFTSAGLDYSTILTNAQQSNWTTVYTLGTAYQKEDGTADAQKILEFFFSYCNEEGEKEFRLDTFKDDEKFSDLYAEGLIDEEAVAYITATKERLQLLSKYINNDYQNPPKTVNYYGNLKFLHETCFLKATGTSACTLSQYSGSSSDSFYFTNLVWNDSELWGTGSEWDYEKQKNSLRLMKILDSNHDFSGDIITLDISFDLNDMYNDRIQIVDGYVYYRNNTSDSYYDIRRIPLEEAGIEENLFTSVSGKWEILSFTVGGEYLYYSSYRGTAINNGRITLSTKENTALDSTFKLTSLTTY